jgi:RNA polymerase sigma-70 factor (ECF subfamily)
VRPVVEAGRGSQAEEEKLRQLMIRYQRAEPAAVEELVSHLSPMLLRFITAPGLARSDAEDMLQDCWLRIHRSRSSYRASEPLLPWIFAIARHAKLDGYRRRRRLGAREFLVAEAPEREDTSGQPIVAAGGSDVERLLNALPESQREVVLMLKVSGMSVEEVARATASTPGAVKQKAHRAYEKLRALLTGGR